MNYAIRLTDVPEEATRRAVLDPLVAYNRVKTGRDDHRPLILTIEDSDAQVIGGLWGRTAYDWLFVELLFVPESVRGRGVGKDLLSRAEREAVTRAVTVPGLTPSNFRRAGFMSVSATRASGNWLTIQLGRRGTS